MANFWGLGMFNPEPVLRIRIGYNNADPDTAFYMMQGDKQRQIHADPDPGQWPDYAVTKKYDFTMKSLLYVCGMS